MKLELDFRSGIPIYIQIMQQIKGQLALGTLLPGDQLPTVRALAQELRVNFNTIARAYRLLDEAMIISTQHGRGTFILKIPSQEMTNKIKQETLADLTQRYLRDVIRLGARYEEIQSMLQQQIIALQETGILPKE